MITAKITPQQYEALREKLRVESGLDLTGNAGKLSKEGVIATYNFDGSTLQITVIKSPFLFSIAHCEQNIRQALAVEGCAAE